jgi:hypothetical protein
MEELHIDSINKGHEGSYGARSRARERAYSNKPRTPHLNHHTPASSICGFSKTTNTLTIARPSDKRIYTFYNKQIADERKNDPESWHSFNNDNNDDLPFLPSLEPLLPPPNGFFNFIDDHAIKRARLERIKNNIRYISESSDNEVINKATSEATDEATGETTDETINDAFVFDDEVINQITDDAINEVINKAFVFDEKVRIDSSDKEAVIEETEGNKKVIKPPVRPRRSSYAKKAPKKSL